MKEWIGHLAGGFEGRVGWTKWLDNALTVQTSTARWFGVGRLIEFGWFFVCLDGLSIEETMDSRSQETLLVCCLDLKASNCNEIAL